MSALEALLTFYEYRSDIQDEAIDSLKRFIAKQEEIIDELEQKTRF